jgi:hypothetical protein
VYKSKNKANANVSLKALYTDEHDTVDDVITVSIDGINDNSIVIERRPARPVLDSGDSAQPRLPREGLLQTQQQQQQRHESV